MGAQLVGLRASNVGKSADALVIGVPSEWFAASGDDIAPLIKVAEVVPFAAPGRHGEVWFICTEPRDVVIAGQIAEEAVNGGAWERATFRYLNATKDVPAAVGDLLGKLLRDDKQVVASDAAGPELVRWALRRACGYAGVPLMTMGPQGEVCVDQGRDATPSLLLGALRFTLTARPSNPATTPGEVHERGFTTLVKVGEDDTYERTHLLDTLLGDIDLARTSDYSSACADLLERRGFPDDAQRLRDATKYWIQQRLWESNFVPEMVLHNEAHSAAVDRNIASLCEPLLELKKNRPIDEVDLLVLAIAAWLHDWGHASATAAGIPIATNPIDVRNLHGIFSASRLAGGATEDKRHEIDQRFAGRGLCQTPYPHAHNGWIAKDVALLCAHHQGWTSCSDQLPQIKPVEEEEITRIKQIDGVGFEVLSFDEEHANETDGRDFTPSQLQANLSKARLRLAILRVADAADVGVHRVPDYRTQQSGRDTIAKRFLDEQEKIAELVLGGRLDENGHQFKPGKLGTLVKRAGEVIADAEKRIRDSGEPPNEENIQAQFRAAMARQHELASLEHSKSWKNPYVEHPDFVSSGKDAVVEIARFAYEYGKHLVTQRAFYDQHEMIRAAIPALLPAPDAPSEWELSLSIIPNLSGAPDDVDLREKWVACRTAEAIWFAKDIVAREFGDFIDKNADGSPTQRTSMKPGSRPKRDIAVYFQTAGVSSTVHTNAVALADCPKVEEYDAPGSHERGVALSPSGHVSARAVAGGIELRDSSVGRSALIPVATEGFSVLAVDGAVGASRALVSWSRGTALLHEPGTGKNRALLRTASAAGVLLPDHGILVDADGRAFLLRLSGSDRMTPVDWLAGCRVLGMDAARYEGGHLVVAACAVDGSYELRAVRGNAEDWESLPVGHLNSDVDQLSVVRAPNSVRVNVSHGGQLLRYRVENDEWQAE